MYKNLLVPVDGSQLSERAMRESIALAKQLGAAIVGFVAEPDMPLPNVGTQPTAYARQRDAHEQRSDTHAHDLLARFGALASEAGVAFSGRHAQVMPFKMRMSGSRVISTFSSQPERRSPPANRPVIRTALIVRLPRFTLAIPPHSF